VDAFKAALANVPGVTQVRYVSSGEARTEFGKEEIAKAADLAALPVEAFPASIEIEVRPTCSSPSSTTWSRSSGSSPPSTMWRPTRRGPSVSRASFAAASRRGLLAFVVFASVLAVIGSTMRLALQRRKTEVEVLRLVGRPTAS